MRTLPLLTVFLFLIFCSSCSRETRFTGVTCQVSVQYEKPYKILIFYKDTVETAYGEWSKEIYFPPSRLASVYVTPVDKTHAYWEDPSLQDRYSYRDNYLYRRPVFTVKMITETDTIISHGENSIFVSIPQQSRMEKSFWNKIL